MPFKGLDSPRALLPELQRHKNNVKCVVLGTGNEAQGQSAKLANGVILCFFIFCVERLRDFYYVPKDEKTMVEILKKDVNKLHAVHQSCSISIFPYRFNINYPVFLLINSNININYSQEGLSISILYQLLKKLPYQFQYQYILSISPYDIVKITNFLSISHCYQYQC